MEDPEVFWKAVCQACQELWQIPGVDKEAITGVALTTQRSTIICMGKDGQPLRPAIVWPDQRRTIGIKPIGGLWGLAFRVSGMSRTSAYLQEQAEASWLRTHDLHRYGTISINICFYQVTSPTASPGTMSIRWGHRWATFLSTISARPGAAIGIGNGRWRPSAVSSFRN